MRHQTALAGGFAAGTSQAFRLDPYVLPVRYSAAVGGGAHGSMATITIDREHAVVRHANRAGAPVTVDLPLKSFDGVAVRLVAVGDGGDLRAIVELRHADLTLPLVVAEEPEEVAADWQAWGRTLNLPLLVVGQNGEVIEPEERVGSLVVNKTRPRRRHSYFAGRRPRFLTRRKVGRRGPREQLNGREIIARN